MKRFTCTICGQPVDPDAPTTLRQVRGWTSAVLNTGPLENKTLTGEYAHEACVEAVERARGEAGAG